MATFYGYHNCPSQPTVRYPTQTPTSSPVPLSSDRGPTMVTRSKLTGSRTRWTCQIYRRIANGRLSRRRSSRRPNITHAALSLTKPSHSRSILRRSELVLARHPHEMCCLLAISRIYFDELKGISKRIPFCILLITSKIIMSYQYCLSMC